MQRISRPRHRLPNFRAMNDLKFSIRSLRKAPGFTLVALLTLALGIGLNTSMFSFVSLLLLQPIPYPDKAHLVRVYRTTPQSQKNDHSAPDYIDIARECGDFMDVAGYRFWEYTMKRADRPAVNLVALRVSAKFFPLLGMRPELGRFFTDDEDRPGNSVVMLSHATWQAHFGSDPSVIGQTVRIDGQPTTVVGVMPAEFSSIAIWGPGDAFRPLALTNLEKVNQNDAQIQVIGRCHSDLSIPQLNARLALVAERMARTRSQELSRDGLRAAALKSDFLSSQGAQMSWLLLGLSGFVLLIVCANLANLQLSRALARSQEFAICSALGASRSRLLRTLLTESFLLALGGGACGILIAQWSNDWLAARMSATGMLSFKLAMDWRVLGFALGTSLVTGMVFGIVPAWMMSRVSVSNTLKSGGRGSTGTRAQHLFRNALIVAQFSLALMLLAGAGSFIRGVRNSVKRDLGWQPGNLLQCVLNLPQTRYATEAQAYSFYTRLEDRLSALPGVESAAVGWSIPVFQFLTSQRYVVEGHTTPPAGHEPMAYLNSATPSYLDTLGIRLLAGRRFTEADRPGATPVAIINESMAGALFPHESPLGRRIGGMDPAHRDWAQIVGVIPDQHFAVGIGVPATRFQVLRPLAQNTWNYDTVVVRSPDPEKVADSVRRVIADMEPDLPIQQLGTVEQLISTFSGLGMVGGILVSFAVLGLFLASLGIYGVIARLVVQRTPEIGVRLALGAQPADAVWLVLGSGIRLVVIGTFVGMLGSYGLSMLLRAIFPDMLSGNSVSVLVSVSVLLIAVALLACWLPARRAAGVDPLTALRSE
jgi:predicted permease